MHPEPEPTTRAEPQPRCPLCGAEGPIAHEDVRDRLYGAPGSWSIRRCGAATCGSLWLDPRPAAEDLPSLYARYYTHEPAARGSRWRRAVSELVRRGVLQAVLGYPRGLPAPAARALAALARLAPSGVQGFVAEAMFLSAPPGRLLEIGSGGGDALATMRALGWSVLGTDFDPGAVEAARGRGLELRLGGVERVQPADGPFDAIFLGHVLEHVPDPLALLERCRALLGPRGRLVVVTPNAESLGARWFGRHWRGLEPPRHLHVFRPAGLERLAARAGLAVQRVETTWQGARYILGYSLHAATGAGPLRGAPSLPARLAALGLQLVERGAHAVAPDSGEEVVLVARRND